jgi:hypothetical protein
MSNHPSENDSHSEGKISSHDFLKYIGAIGAILGLSSLSFIKTFGDLSNETNLHTSSESKPIPHTSPHTLNLDSL